MSHDVTAMSRPLGKHASGLFSASDGQEWLERLQLRLYPTRNHPNQDQSGFVSSFGQTAEPTIEFFACIAPDKQRDRSYNGIDNAKRLRDTLTEALRHIEHNILFIFRSRMSPGPSVYASLRLDI